MSHLIKIFVGGLIMMNGWLWNPSLELLIGIEVVGGGLAAWGIYGVYRAVRPQEEDDDG